VAAVPAQAHALAGLEERHIGGNRIYHPGNLMAGNARIGNAGKSAELCNGIAVANSAGLDADAHLPRTWLRKLFLYHLKGSAHGWNLYGTSKN
jgi:hypothetical protein